MTEPKDHSGKRFMKLAGMTARISKDVARSRWQRLWKNESTRSEQDAELFKRVGSEIAKTLGDMKGAVMKVGQVVSQYRDVLPEELVDALSSLQKTQHHAPLVSSNRAYKQLLGTN